MATLIGNGGHARDIAGTRYFARRVSHHKQLTGNHRDVVIGINDPQLRDEVSREIGIEDAAWVHPDAYLGPDCTYRFGTHINYGVSMTRTTIGHHCTIAPGVTICGDVTIGDRVFIGAGAVIRNLISIGDDAFICMGSIVTRNVESGERYRGRT